MAKKPKYTVCGYFPQPDGSYIPLEEVPPEELARWKEKKSKELSEVVSRCVNADPEAHRAFLENCPDAV